MPRGGTLELAVARHAADAAGGPGVELRVRDTGQGMPPEVRGRAFEPLFTTKGERGTGLGLAICAGVVEQAGGTIHLDSQPGQGTTIRIRLPGVPPPASAEPVAPVRRRTGSGEYALVVDDALAMHDIIGRVVARCGLEALVARSVAEARACLARRSRAPSVVLTDARLPDGDGLGLLRGLRAAGREVPSIVMAGALPAVQAVQLKALGARFLAKPFAPVALEGLITETLGLVTGAR
jgi:CheY-like chemotaxis protein